MRHATGLNKSRSKNEVIVLQKSLDITNKKFIVPCTVNKGSTNEAVLY